VSLIDSNGKEVGKGKITLIEGIAQGKSLNARVCTVHVTDLSIEEWREVTNPSEVSERMFQEAESKNGA
jgi:hypothetical protein